MGLPSLRTIVTWVIIAIVVVAVVKHPDQAGGLVHDFTNFIGQAANGLSNFVARA